MTGALICQSVHHGNTAKVARAMAAVLAAEVMTPEQARVSDLSACDLLGFGSGIYAFRHHPTVLQLAREIDVRDRATFVFSTCGFNVLWLNHLALRAALRRRGAQIVGEFSCRGFDTFGPLRLFGGINRGRPGPGDLQRAERFARRIARKIS